MKTLKITSLLLFLSFNSFAQCYATIVSYHDTMIALKTDGTLWARGQNQNNLGGNVTTGQLGAFTQIGNDANWTENISMCYSLVFAIKTDGTLWVWGKNNASGAAGLGSFENFIIAPTQVGTESNWAKVTTSEVHTLAVKTDGTLWAWGSNARGQLGIGNVDDTYKVNVPIQVGSDNNWQKAFTESSRACLGIKFDGTLWAWGADGVNLGYANATLNNAYRSPRQVGTGTWLTAAVGLGGIINGIKTDGSLWAWGSSTGGSYLFGNGIDPYSSSLPIQIGTATDWKDVCVSSTNTIALKTNGSRWGWGRNLFYELGLGEGFNTVVTTPIQLDTDTDWKLLSSDLFYGWGDGIKQDNSLYHWSSINVGASLYYTPTLLGTSCLLSTSDFKLEEKVTLYPNPSEYSTIIHFKENFSNECWVTLTNSLGQVVFEEKKLQLNRSNEILLDVSLFKSGIYIMRISSTNKTVQIKLLKN